MNSVYSVHLTQQVYKDCFHTRFQRNQTFQVDIAKNYVHIETTLN